MKQTTFIRSKATIFLNSRLPRKSLLKYTVISFLFVFSNPVLAALQASQLVYFNDFETSAGPEWSQPMIERTPSTGHGSVSVDRGFLGRFGHTSSTTLSLEALPEHDVVTISFDLYVIQSWDGNQEFFGADVWGLRLGDGRQLIQTTFSAVEPLSPSPQAYPDQFPGGNNPAGASATEINSLGYTWPVLPGYLDSVYHLEFTIHHDDDAVGFEFFSRGLQSLNDESWGLDNVSVSVGITLDNVNDHVAFKPDRSTLEFSSDISECTDIGYELEISGSLFVERERDGAGLDGPGYVLTNTSAIAEIASFVTTIGDSDFNFDQADYARGISEYAQYAPDGHGFGGVRSDILRIGLESPIGDP